MTDKNQEVTRNEEIKKAIFILQNMFDELTNRSGEVMVGRLTNKEVITVVIRGGCYDINVAADSIGMMIREVVDRVICKI